MPFEIVPELDDLVGAVRISQITMGAIQPLTVKAWRRRGHLPVSGLDERGRPMYRWIDVLKAERATRNRSNRKFESAVAA